MSDMQYPGRDPRATGAGDERQARLIAILEATSDLVSTATPDGRLTYLNQAGRRLVGWGLDEPLAGRRIADLHPSDALRRIESEALPAARGSGAWEGETALLARSGEEIPVSQVVLAHRSPAGEVQYFSTIMRDISERKRAERALRESEETARNVVQSSPMGIHIYHLLDDGELVFAGGNPAADRLLGIGHEQFMGLRLEEAFPPLRDTELPARYREAARAGATWHDDHFAYDYGGISGVFEVFAFQLSPGKVAVLFNDVTSRARAEAERERLRDQLSQAQKMESIGRLAGGVAHDFNNMLGVILGSAEQLLAELPAGSPQREVLLEIQCAAERSADLTRQLLAFARKQTIQPRPLDLNAAVGRVLKLLRRLLGESAELAWSPGGALWAVEADPSQIDQLLMNLCVNARDAIAGCGRIAIETANVTLGEAEAAALPDGAPGEHVLLAVRDSGGGLSQEALEHLYEPFFTTKPDGRGSGLGLATVYGIVRQNGGFIAVDSAPGAGTTFRVYLPRRAAAAPPEAQQPGGQDAPEGCGETILVVEDEPSVHKLVAAMLRRLGYEVLVAESPEEAERLAASRPGGVDLLLTDVVMPRLNGRELAGLLVRQHPGLRCLFMSGYSADVIAHHGVLDPGVAFIQKPFSVRELGQKVREALSLRAAPRS